jgi:hypothetical protein
MIDFDPRGDYLAGGARGNIVRSRTVGLAYYDSRRNGVGPTSTRKVFPNRMVLGDPDLSSYLGCAKATEAAELASLLTPTTHLS